MTYQPVVVGPGLAGWAFLQRSYDAQIDIYSKTPEIERDTDYFVENIGSVTSANDLVSDYRLLRVALGAFGLQDDQNNRYFIQRILEDGTTADDALAVQLADDRYKKFSEAFSFGPGQVPTVTDMEKMADIVEAHKVQSFEVAVGTVDESMRIALYAQRELEVLAQDDGSEETKWYSLLALPPLRQMFETALNLPSGVGGEDIEKQVEIFQERLFAATGSSDIAQFQEAEPLETVTNLYLARAQINSFSNAASSASIALQLLQG